MLNQISEGSRLLVAAGTVAATASTIGVTTRTISSWRSGAKRPSEAAKIRLRDAFQIPIEAWGLLPGNASHDGVAAPNEPFVEPREGTAIDGLRVQLGRIRRQRQEPGLTPRTALDLEKLELGVLQAIARVEDTRLSEPEIANSLAYRRMVDRLVDALTPHPEALNAAIKAFAPQDAS
jgi:hypothetical protein